MKSRPFSESLPVVVWELYGDTLLPLAVSPRVASRHQLNEGDEIDSALRRRLIAESEAPQSLP